MDLCHHICRSTLNLDDSFFDKSNEFILNYLNEFSSKEKGTEVYRAMLILVGAGNVGKTTLVKRLKSNITGTMKVDARMMTDGIDISEIKLKNPKTSGEIIFTVYDFAGQEEYIHTHALFVIFLKLR